MAKLTQCKICGAQIAHSAKNCPTCGAKNISYRKKKFLKSFLTIYILLVFIGIVVASTIDTSSTSNVSQNEPSKTEKITTTIPAEYEGDCGISVSAEMYANMINFPEISISITNKTNKKIEAIKFFIVPYDVYGDEIKSWATQQYLYTDTSIAAGRSNKISYQFLEQSVETVDLYVYSVYFEDGTEWGNKDATKSSIIKYGVPFEVYGES